MTLFIPLLPNLEPYFAESFAELPSELQELIKGKSERWQLLGAWDSMSADQRREAARQADDQEGGVSEINCFAMLYILQENLEGWIDEADRKDKDAAVVYLEKIQKQIHKFMGNNREALEREAQQLRSTQVHQSQSGTQTKQKTYLRIIHALKEYLLDGLPEEKGKRIFDNQTKLVEALVEHHPELNGMSKRTLETVFAAANRSLSED